jgi:hypothetical protein
MPFALAAGPLGRYKLVALFIVLDPFGLNAFIRLALQTA